MATNLNANPIFVQGSVTGYKSQTQTAQGTLRSLEVQRIRWQNPGVSKTISIGDPVSGTVLEQMTSNTAGEDVEIDYVPTRLWQDFAIDTFPGSGTLLIFTR
jgi:hypothetical protein